jgi:hypothetical protein
MWDVTTQTAISALSGLGLRGEVRAHNIANAQIAVRTDVAEDPAYLEAFFANGGADVLDKFNKQLIAEGVPAPGLRPDFPIARQGVGQDPMRMASDELATWYRMAGEAYRSDDPWLARWLVALAGHSAVSKPERGDVRLTPFYAPTGQMTLRGSLLDATTSATEAIGGPGDALTAWRRSGYDGANFDGRATRDRAVTTTGKPTNQGAPSPTWLALMGLRFFVMTDDGRDVQTVGWQRIRLYPGYTARSLVWPCWEPELDAAAVALEQGRQPAARASASEQNQRWPRDSSMRVWSYQRPPGTW